MRVSWGIGRMAERRDYLLRMIEQMGAVMARLREMILGGVAGSLEEIRRTGARAGVDIGLARALETESLVALLSPDGSPDSTRIWVLAELLALEGLDAERRGNDEEALSLYRKALRLYLAIDPRVIGGIPEAEDRRKELEHRITILTDTSPSAA